MSASGELERFTELLEFEIDRIRAEEAQPGWTMWALLGAEATVLWFIISELENNKIDLFNVLFLLLALFLIYDFLKEILSVIPQGSPTRSLPPRVTFAHSMFSQTRIYSLTTLGRSMALIMVTIMIRPFVGTRYIAAACVFYGRLALASASRFLLSFLRIPSPTSYRDARWDAIVLRLLLLVPGILALFSLSSMLSSQTISPAVFEYRFSGLLVAAILILLMIAQGQSRAPLLATLMHIRRDLTFGNVNLTSAKRQVEIALIGMKVADAFQSDLGKLLSDLEQANTRLDAVEGGFQRIRPTIDRSEGTRMSIEAIQQSVQANLSNAEEALIKFQKRYRGFRWRTGFFLGRSTELKEERDELLDGLIAMRKAVEERIERSKQITQDIAKSPDSAEKEQETPRNESSS